MINNDSQLVYKLLYISVAYMLNKIVILKIKYHGILRHIVRSVTTSSRQKKYLDFHKFGILIQTGAEGVQDLRVGRASVTPTSGKETTDHRFPVMLARTSRTKPRSASRVVLLE